MSATRYAEDSDLITGDEIEFRDDDQRLVSTECA